VADGIATAAARCTWPPSASYSPPNITTGFPLWFSRWGHADICELLILAGARVDCVDREVGWGEGGGSVARMFRLRCLQLFVFVCIGVVVQLNAAAKGQSPMDYARVAGQEQALQIMIDKP